MKQRHSTIIATAGAFVMACAVFAPGDAQALELYDTFKGLRYPGVPGKRLDPEKWDAWNSQGALDLRREVAGGKVILKSVTYGATGNGDSGRTTGRSTIPFPESVAPDITEIQATVQTASIGLISCDGNDAFDRVLSPRIAGYWFNDGSSTGADDRTGDVWAHIDARRARFISDPVADGGLGKSARALQVVGYAERCNDATCSAPVRIADTITLGFINRGQKRRLRIKWDPDNDRFVFQLHKLPEQTMSYAGLDDSNPPGGSYFKRIEHRTQADNCDNPPEPTAAFGEVRIFDVMVNEPPL